MDIPLLYRGMPSLLCNRDPDIDSRSSAIFSHSQKKGRTRKSPLNTLRRIAFSLVVCAGMCAIGWLMIVWLAFAAESLPNSSDALRDNRRLASIALIAAPLLALCVSAWCFCRPRLTWPYWLLFSFCLIPLLYLVYGYAMHLSH